MPSDFRVKTLDGIAEDWPFTYEQLLPYLEDVEHEVGVSGLPGKTAYLPQKAFPTPPLPIGKVGRKAAEGLDKLGWHWWPGTNAIPSVPYNGLNASVRRGTCMTGCPEGAKSTSNITYWPHALKSGAWLITGARVREIEVDDNGMATGAVYIDENGRERRQRARTVIVCANGIGTPRLLLLSKSKRFPNGLANSSGMVGKRLMMHPFSAVLGIFNDPLESWQGPFGHVVTEIDRCQQGQRAGHRNDREQGAPPQFAALRSSSCLVRRLIHHTTPLLGAWSNRPSWLYRRSLSQSSQNFLNRSDDSSVYRTVSVMFLCPRSGCRAGLRAAHDDSR